MIEPAANFCLFAFVVQCKSAVALHYLLNRLFADPVAFAGVFLMIYFARIGLNIRVRRA
jgi:hypothetical protein